MKKLFLGLFFVSMMIVLTGCSGDKASSGKIELNFWHMSPVGDPTYAKMKGIINEFNKSQDKYYVKGTGFSFWDYWDKVNIAVSSDTAPDIGFHTLDNVVLRAENDALYNITDLMSQDEEAIDLTQFYQNQLSFATYEDDLYALPFTATTRVMFYNKDMFAAAGLTEDDVPTTWSELETVAKRLDKVKSNGEITQLGFDPTYGQGTYHGYLWQAGLDYFDENLNPTLNTPRHVEILDWMLNFNDEFSKSTLQAFGDANAMLGIDPFAAGRVAMIVATDGLYQTIRTSGADLNYGVAPIPVPDQNGVRVNWGSGFSIELYKNGNGNAEKAQGAYEFVKYLMEKDTQIKLAEGMGWIMAHKAAMAEYAEGNEILEALVAEVAYATDKVYVPYAPSWHAADWQTFYDEGLQGNKTAEQILRDARAFYLQKQANYNQINK